MFSDEWYDSTASYIENKLNCNTNGYVYIIKSMITGEVKIGRSDDPQVRINAIRSYIGDILVIGIIKYNGSENLEMKIHNIFKDYRVRGEWFEGISNDKLISCISENNGWYINRKFINSNNILDTEFLDKNKVDMSRFVPTNVIEYFDSLNVRDKGKHDKKVIYEKSGMKDIYSQRKLSSMLAKYLDYNAIEYYEKKSGNVRYFDVL